MGKMSCSIVHFIILFLAMESSRYCFGKNTSFRCISAERKALLKFKASLTDAYNRLSSWEVTTDCCAWQGVGCDEITRHVITLDLKNTHPFPIFGDDPSLNTLASKNLDSSLLELKYLRYLDLSFNDFQYSPIPAFLGSMKQLQHLNLSRAQFSGVVPYHLGNLSRLRVLDLNFAGGLEVDNLMWASNLSSLEYLGMSYADFSGTKDSSQVLFNMLPSMLELHLAFCGLDKTHLSHACGINSSSSLANIQHLDLSWNSFDGEFPCFLHNMTSLQALDLSSNNYSSFGDHLLRLRSLVHLNLLSNSLHYEADRISEFVANKCHLKLLNLFDNHFYGDISGVFKNLSVGCWNHNLETLYLGGNAFYGHFPEELVEFKQLNHLILSDNAIRGPISYSLGKLSALRELDISNNNLSGPIPSSFENLKELRDLRLGGNQLSGEIPIFLGQLSNLERMELSFNGTLSETHFVKMSKLKFLRADSINLNVGFDWVPPFQLQRLFMSSCRIGGQFPQWLQTQKSLEYLEMSNCGILGTLPKWFHYINLTSLDLSRNHIEGPMPKLAPKLLFLHLSDNMMNGTIHDSLCKMEYLMILDLSRNHFSGNIPDCWEYRGIFGIMRLSFNELSGVIPTSIGEACSFGVLHLDNNRLTGQLPSTLRNCRYLEALDVGDNKLSGNLPDWIGTSMPNLRVVKLRNNDFYGTIPSTFCQLLKLHVMDLANNKLTGNIPHCFGKLLGMAEDIDTGYLRSWDEHDLSQVMNGVEREYTTTSYYVVNLDLSSNILVGEIPRELTNLSSLVGLNLSNNRLRGEIPENIGDLKSLLSLDLSSNNLFGTIPYSLSGLNFLTHLNLSHNNLSGPIPTGNQLQTLNDPSIYDGNAGLCGPPLLKKCLDNGAKKSPNLENHEAGDEGDRAEKIIFYGVIISGFATGFWGIIVVLVVKKSWRHAYFRFAEMLIHKVLGL